MSRVGTSRGIHVAGRGLTRHGHAVSGVPPASPRPAESDASAAPLEPRPCSVGLCPATWIPRLAPTWLKSSRLGSYWPNIGVFRPEKGNRPVRRKKKNLKPKTPVDLIRRLHRLNPFLLLLFCFFVFFFFFFRSVTVLFCCQFKPKFKDFSRLYRSVTHCS